VAAKYGRVDVARLLLQDRRGADVDITGKNRLSALHVATHYGQRDVVLVLLQHAANTRAVTKVIVRFSNNLCSSNKNQ